MRLISLKLKNFRQHVDTEIHFQNGLTGIIGPNGSGKSTILEAIAWAIYGSSAARGTNDTIRYHGAPNRSRVEVELVFMFAGHRYRVVRSLHHAEVFLDSAEQPVAVTVGGVSDYLEKQLGMSLQEFFQTYFTGQKDLQFLADMGAADRARFLNQVLGYERIKEIQDRTRERRNHLRQEINALRRRATSLEEAAAARAEAEARLAAVEAELASTNQEAAERRQEVGRLAPEIIELEGAQRRYHELKLVQEGAREAIEAARRDLNRAEAELHRLQAAEVELARLDDQLIHLDAAREEAERWNALERAATLRRQIENQIAEIEADLRASEDRLRRLEQAPALLEQFAAETAAAEKEEASLRATLEELRTRWMAERESLMARGRMLAERKTELIAHIEEIRAAGPKGVCRVCERPLEGEFLKVLSDLEAQLVAVEHEGRAIKERLAVLREPPGELATLDEQIRAAAQRRADAARKHAHCERGVEELGVLSATREAKTKRLAELQADLATIPQGYDPKLHQAAAARLAALQEQKSRAQHLRELLRQQQTWQAERDEAASRLTASEERLQAALREVEALGFSEGRYVELKTAYEKALDLSRHAEIRAKEVEGQCRLAQQSLENAQAVENEARRQAEEIVALEDDLRHHNELDSALTELRADLNAELRPEFSALASGIIAELTDGRYSGIEIGEDYAMRVLDGGEERTVISGGEEDIANLALRLALSQMIADRAGHPFTLLVLDEVFGSLDQTRRDNVIQLLHRLQDRFEQVILITHVEGIRDMLDHVLRVDRDEKTGAARVTQDHPDTSSESPLFEWDPVEASSVI